GNNGASGAAVLRGGGTAEAAVAPRVGLPSTFYLVLAAVTLFSLGNSSDMFLVMRAQSIGIAPRLAPLLGLVFNITYTLGSWPAGWFTAHFSPPRLASLAHSLSPPPHLLLLP